MAGGGSSCRGTLRSRFVPEDGSWLILKNCKVLGNSLCGQMSQHGRLLSESETRTKPLARRTIPCFYGTYEAVNNAHALQANLRNNGEYWTRGPHSTWPSWTGPYLGRAGAPGLGAPGGASVSCTKTLSGPSTMNQRVRPLVYGSPDTETILVPAAFSFAARASIP